MHARRKLAIRACTAVLVILGSACASSSPEMPLPEPLPIHEERTYRIAPGDLLEIRSLTDPVLNATARVAPDGTIALQMAGYLDVAGLTPEELDRKLTAKLSDSVRNPRLTVIVTEFGPSLVFVGGEVFTPQRIKLNGSTTALSAILTAGGYTPEADLGSVVLIRRDNDGLPVTRTYDLKSFAQGLHQGATDPILLAADIVIVPPTMITEANRFVDQYIKRMLPGTLGATFTYTRGVQTFN